MSFKQYLITMPHQITTLGNFYGSFFFFFWGHLCDLFFNLLRPDLVGTVLQKKKGLGF